MPFATPSEIRKKATGVYRKYLRAWINGSADEFFPYRLGVGLTLAKDFATARSQRETLLKSSKQPGRKGYTVHMRKVQTRDFGKNQIPRGITIDTLDDLLFLTGTEKDFAAAGHVIDQVRIHLPELEPWLQQNAGTLHKLADRIEGLIAVARYFKENPTREHFLRQIRVPSDSKFAERNTAILDAWLQRIVPPSSIDLTQQDFSRRYGLPVAEGHWMLRVLDPTLLPKLGLPFSELSLPVAAIAQLPLGSLTILITENRIPLLTLPELPQTVALWGQGNAVVHLQSLKLLHECRLLYWGDLDVEGFQILARLRANFPHTQSVLMDEATLRQHLQWKVAGTGATCEVPENLTPEERVAFEYCVRENCRVEQERVAQAYVEAVLGGAW